MNITVSTAGGQQVLNPNISYFPLDKKQRLKRASKVSSLILGTGIVFIFVPVLHFFIPPGCLLASIITFVLRINDQALLVAESFSCLRCSHSFRIHQGVASGQDSYFNCPSCSQRHYISLPKA